MRNALYFWNNLGVVRALAPSAGAEEELWRLVEEVGAEGEGGAGEGQGVAHGVSLFIFIPSRALGLWKPNTDVCARANSRRGGEGGGAERRDTAGRAGASARAELLLNEDRRADPMSVPVGRCASSGSTSKAWCGLLSPPPSLRAPRSALTPVSAPQLTNLGALPLSRIHSTLNMLAPGYKGKTTDELTALLEAVAAEGLVTCTASGGWKIVK